MHAEGEGGGGRGVENDSCNEWSIRPNVFNHITDISDRLLVMLEREVEVHCTQRRVHQLGLLLHLTNFYIRTFD